MRKLDDVINQVLEHIPENRTTLRNDLNNIKESASFAAPEMKGMWWSQAAVALADELGDVEHTDGWERTVQSIFRGESE